MSPRKRTSPWRPSSARATEIFILEVSRPTKTALSCCMARPLCVRLGAGPSGATLVRRIARDEPPPLQQRTYGLPDVLNRVQFGRSGRKQHEREIVWHDEILGAVPSGPVHQHDPMGSGSHGLRDLGQVQAHGPRVASRQDQGRALALLGADCSEDVDRTRPLIMRGARPGAPSGPAPGDLVLLADTGLVLPPQLDRGALREARPDRLQGGGETFLKSSSASGFWA